MDWMNWRDGFDELERWFPMEFRKYVRDQNLLCCKLTPNYWFFENKYEPYAAAFRHMAFQMMSGFLGFLFPQNCLIQFWRAERVVNSPNDFQLTTLNQPFLLTNDSEGLYLYRLKTHDVIIIGDGRGGAISRVFNNNRIEFSPDVRYYSYDEYPQRVYCHIKGSIIFPLSDRYGRTVGVVEFVSQSDWPIFFAGGFLLTLMESSLMYLDPRDQKSDMMYLNPCKRLCGQYDLDKDSLVIAVSEIKEVIGVLCRSFDIVTAQTWMLCKHCNSLSTSEGCAYELGASYQRFIEGTYVEFGSYCILREGEGVVGRAAVSSHTIVYCENVAKFSITEYPLAHFVLKDNLSASFAICLQSNRSGDQVYVLELFLGPSYVSWGLREKLIPILDKMRHWFQTFKVAYGGEVIGDNLSAQVINASFPDTVETLDPFQDISMDDVPVASVSTVQSEIKVTIKANYGGDFVRFHLSASSGIHELHHQVSQRLELTKGTYDLSYRDDDNDLILLTCDEDLQFYISSSTEQENYTLMVSIELKRALPL